MKTLRVLFTLLVVFATMSVFASPPIPSQLPTDFRWIFAQGSTLNLTFTPDAGYTYQWFGFDADGKSKAYPVGQLTITIPNVTQVCEGAWSLWATKTSTKMISTYCYLVKITSNLVVPDLVVTGSVGTGTAATTNVLFTTTGTQTAIVGFIVRGSSLETGGLATPKVQLLNSKGVVVATGVVATGDITKDYACDPNCYMTWCFGLGSKPKGNNYMFATIGPGIYTIVVTTSIPGNTGRFELNMSPYN